MKSFFAKFALFALFSFITNITIAQAPQKMSYQAVIRNNSNALVTNSPIGMKISILQGSSTGTVVYAETQLANSNANGLVTIEIGSGTAVTGTFSVINWANGPYFIKTEADPSGGSSYSITGTSQLMSVPYALYAEKVAIQPTAFSAYSNSGQTFSVIGDYVTFDAENYDEGNLFANNTYTAPVNGIYHFDVHLRLNGDATAGNYFWIGLHVNNILKKDCTSQTNTNTFGINLSADLKLSAGDQVQVYLYHPGSLASIANGSYNTWFDGHKIN